MKKISLSLMAIAFAINFSYAQWTTGPGNINNTNSGNVGIGTTSPVETLDVIGTVKANSLNVKGSTSVEVAALTGTGMGYAPTTYPVSAVGILSGSGVTSIGYNPLTNTGGNFTGNGSEVLFRNTVKFIQPNASGTDYLSPTMTLSNGNVGIGTLNPDQKLAVKGTIHSQEVIVDMSVLPDYVFKPTYHLPTLTEVKTYIDQNHHLPEMPSAEQVEKDGLSLGDMNAKLLKKVEELTLYLIEKDNMDKEKEAQLISQQKEIDKLEQQVSTLIKSKS